MKNHSKNQNSIKILDEIYVIVMLNFYALIGIFSGLIVFGLFPSVSTTYKMMKNHHIKEEVSFKIFFKTYKKDFKKTNGVGFMLTLMGGILLLSLNFYQNQLSSTISWVAIIVVSLLLIIWIFVFNSIFVVNAFFENLTLKKLFSMTLLIIFGMPMLSLNLILNGLFFYGLVIFRFVSFIPFIIISLPAYFNIKIATKKILNIFTLYQDEFISVRTVYGGIKEVDILTYIEEFVFFDDNRQDLSHLFHSCQIDNKTSLILINHSGSIVGELLTSIHEENLHIIHFHIQPEYRHRGYGRKMIELLETLVIKNKKASIMIGYEKCEFQKVLPSSQLKTFLEKQQFECFYKDNKFKALKVVKDA